MSVDPLHRGLAVVPRPGATVVAVGQPAGPIVPTEVRPPCTWPDPEQGGECDDCQDISWCDSSWAQRYAELYKAHDELMHVVRSVADSCAEAGSADERRIGRHLRAKVGEAAVRRHTMPPPNRSV